MNTTRLAEPLDAVRTSAHIASLTTSTCPVDQTPVALEMNRLEKGHTGAMQELVIEFASSTVPCVLGLHAVDVRHLLADDAFENKQRDRCSRIAREALNELKALATSMPIVWGLLWTFGRGPSIAELFQGRGSAVQLGGVYLSHRVSDQEIRPIVQSATAIDIGPGRVLLWTKLFGGALETLASETRTDLWKILRKASVSGLPWDVL